MKLTSQPEETLNEIKRMMERSSRFISLSGWSGIAAGLTALGGAWLAVSRIASFRKEHGINDRSTPATLDALNKYDVLVHDLLLIAAGVFAIALVTAFGFTYIRSKKTGVMIWGTAALRLLWNTIVPLAVGGVVVARMLTLKYYLLVAPCCLIFYGLALINGSKYTLGEVKYLGYCQLVLGLINLWVPEYGMICWATGFGLLHIVYGTLMWWKHERFEV